MAAGAFERAGLTASVVSLSILRATAYAPNKKANPSRGKMALSYLVQVDLADKKFVSGRGRLASCRRGPQLLLLS